MRYPRCPEMNVLRSHQKMTLTGIVGYAITSPLTTAEHVFSSLAWESL
jgi:hypothetical protein